MLIVGLLKVQLIRLLAHLHGHDIVPLRLLARKFVFTSHALVLSFSASKHKIFLLLKLLLKIHHLMK